MASPIEELLSRVQQPALRPLVAYDANKIQKGQRQLTNLQLQTAAQSIIRGGPVLHKQENHGLLNDIIGLPGNLVRDATQTAQGIFSPWKWIPSIWHNVETGDIPALLPLIPGYTTVKNVISGDFHDILTHPAGTVLDVLPYAHYALPKVAEGLYGAAQGTDAAKVVDAATQATDAIKANPELTPATNAIDTVANDIPRTGRSLRIEAAMREGKPGRTLYQLLPDKITNPEEGVIGKRLSGLQLTGATTRASAQANRGFINAVHDNYIAPLNETFKDFTPEERKGFVQWHENYNELTPNQWTDAAGNVHLVPEKLQAAMPVVQDILNDIEHKAHDFLTTIWHEVREVLYNKHSAVVAGRDAVSQADKALGDAREAANVARDRYVEHMHEDVSPATPVTVSKVVEPGSKATFEATPEGLNPVEPRKPVYSTLPRKNIRLFRVQDLIDQIKPRLDDLYTQREMAVGRSSYVKLTSQIERAESRLASLTEEQKILSRREILLTGLKNNPNMHVSPEDYSLLDANVPGEKKFAQAYKRKLLKLDEARANVTDVRTAYDTLLKTHAPATFYPYLRDVVVNRIIDKYRQNHPDFLEGANLSDPALTRAALDQFTQGKDPVAAGLITQPELDQMVTEVESTWQTLAREGLNPQYMSTVPSSRFPSTLDPNLFRSGALRAEPYSVMERVMDLTPSGIKDPVVGLTAPALAILRRQHLQEFYNSFLSHFVKPESELDDWLSKELDNAKLDTRVGESYQDRRLAIKASRWRAVDPANFDPEFAALFPKGEKVYLPKEMYDNVTKMFGAGTKDGLKSLSTANIHGMRVFRTAVMGLSAKHLAHITFGGLSMLLLRGGLEELRPDLIRAAWNMAKEDLLPKELSAGVDFYNHRQVENVALPAEEDSNIATRAAGKVSSGLAKVQSFEERIANFERSLSYLSELDRILNGKGTPHLSQIENGEVRAALAKGDTEHAVELAKRGAIKHANKALIDFDGMLPAERGIIRNIFPFYAFTRHIFKYAFTYPIDYPLRAAFVYRLGEIVQKDMQDQGLPDQWMRYLTFGPDKEGNVTNVDLRFLNPFRSLPDDASGSGLVNTLNPFLGYAMEWAGVNPWTTSPERFPEIRYNPQTGQVETKRKPFSLLGLVSQLVPEAGVLGGLTGDQTASGLSNNLSRYAFLPLLPHAANINLQRARDTLGQLEEAQQAVDTALRTGDTTSIREWNLVPVPGLNKLVPGSELAKLIDSLPNKNNIRKQLGVR